MAHKTGIYLGRSGKVFGPILEVELQRLMKTGEISNYSWIWNEKTQAWSPLESPPPEPGHPADSSIKEGLEAVCYDQFNLAHGRIEDITQTGCRLVVTHRAAQPLFPVQSRAQLNLAIPNKKSTTLTPVQIIDVKPSSTDRKWIYTLRWARSPMV